MSIDISIPALKGFFVVLRCPSEEGLHISVDASSLSPQRFMQLIFELQDALTVIDLSYAESDMLRGRSVKARHRRMIYSDERRRVLRFSPFPSRFINAIKGIRRDLYNYAHRYCIVIQTMPAIRGAGKRNVYLLPEEEAEKFLTRVNRLNIALDRIEDDVNTFKDSKEFHDIMDILARYDLAVEYKFHVSRVDALLLPVRIDHKVVENWAARSASVSNALKHAQSELIKRAVDDLKQKLMPIVKRVAVQKRLKSSARELRRLETLAKDIGLNAVAASISELAWIAENPEEATQTFHEGIDARVKALIEQL